MDLNKNEQKKPVKNCSIEGTNRNIQELKRYYDSILPITNHKS